MSAVTDAPTPTPSWWLPVLTLWQREMVRFYRQKNRIVGALLTPIVFWALIGGGLNGSFSPGARGGMSYLEYFLPGSIVLMVLFTAIFSTISIIEDRQEGFLQSVLIAPVPRLSIVLGKMLGGTALAVVQALIFLLLAPLVGLKLTPATVLVSVAVLFLVAFGLTGVGYCIAWKLDSSQGFHAIMNLFLMPMWLLSGAFFPAPASPGAMRTLMLLNPLTYGMAALRHALYPGALPDIPSLGWSLGVWIAFCGVILLLATRVSSRRIGGDIV